MWPNIYCYIIWMHLNIEITNKCYLVRNYLWTNWQLPIDFNRAISYLFYHLFVLYKLCVSSNPAINFLFCLLTQYLELGNFSFHSVQRMQVLENILCIAVPINWKNKIHFKLWPFYHTQSKKKILFIIVFCECLIAFFMKSYWFVIIRIV